MKLKQFSFLCIFLSSPLLAEPAKPNSELPSGPLVQKRAPDFAQWVITAAPTGGNTTSNKSANNEGENTAKRYWGSVVTVTKTGKILLRKTTDALGKVWETWCVDDLQITLYPGGKSWIAQGRSNDPEVPAANFEDYSQTDFPGFEWISLGNYTGLKDAAGKKCMLFQAKVKMTSDYPEGTESAAFVDFNSRFPVALNLGGNAHSYEFGSAPQVMMTLPLVVQELMENQQKMMSSATRKSPSAR